MDIKSKKFSHSILIKLVLFIIVVVSFTLLISSVTGIARNAYDYEVLDCLTDENYFASNKFNRDFYYKLEDLKNKVINEKLKVSIENGDTITNQKIKERLANQLNQEKILKTKYSVLEKKYSDEILKIKNDIKFDELKEISKESKKYELEDIKYFISSGDINVTNVKNFETEEFLKNDFHILIDDIKNIVSIEEINKKSYYFSQYLGDLQEISDKIYLTMPNEKLNENIINWENNKRKAEKLFRQLVLLFILGMISFIYLVMIIGRDGESKKVKLNFIDRLYVDINIILIISLLSLLVFSFEVLMKTLNVDSDIYFYFIISLISTFGLILVLSLIRQLKNKTFFKNTILYGIMIKLFTLIKNIFIKIFVFFKKIFNIKIFGFKIIPLKNLNEIKKGAEKIREGNLDYKIKINDKGILKELSEEINMIAQGLKKAVSNEVKSQKMKTKLITNVSHDIRTPLTSIITYVDLIKSEESEKKKNEYLRIIDKKSQRLKNLTDDLFEVSKVDSGNINIKKEKINLVDLINQALGEFESNIKKSKLDFRFNFDVERDYYINADGKFFWRVMENLLSNILKYTLESSRVYIEIFSKNDKIILSLKNISKYELNISAQELMERFSRGDISRKSPGSGLGLSIAKGLIEAQDGRFDISIDGDLFKVTITINKWIENEQ